MKRRKKAILIAMVMGDGYISERDKTLKLAHSKKQLLYLEHKRNLLHELLGGKRPVIREYLHLGKYPIVSLEKADKYFRVLRKWMYPDKYKHLEYLTPEAIALWYMDDGSIVANNKRADGSCRSARTNIHLCVRDKEVAERVCHYFLSTWGIKFTVFNEKGNWSIRCFHQEGAKFHELIHPYIIPSMQYKQRFYYPRAQGPSQEGDDIVCSHGKDNRED